MQSNSQADYRWPIRIVFLFKVYVFYIKLRLISDSLREDTEFLTLVSHVIILFTTLSVF